MPVTHQTVADESGRVSSHENSEHRSFAELLVLLALANRQPVPVPPDFEDSSERSFHLQPALNIIKVTVNGIGKKLGVVVIEHERQLAAGF